MPKLISPKVKAVIQDLAAQGYSAAEISAQIENNKAFYGHDLPARRTVQLLVKQYRQKDTSEAWTIEDCDNPADAQIVLRHIQRRSELALYLGLSMPKISKRLADLLIRVHHAAPNISLSDAWSAAMGLLYGADDPAWLLFLAWQPKMQNATGIEKYSDFENLATRLLKRPPKISFEFWEFDDGSLVGILPE